MAGRLKWYGAPARAFVDGLVARAFRAAGRAWVAEARDLAPVDTGALRDSIASHYDEPSRRLVLSCNVAYALFQEFGTRFHKAHAFMRPALAAIPAFFRSSVDLSAPETPEKYAEGIVRDHAHKVAPSRLVVGRRRR